MTETPLDTAHAAMEAAPENNTARLRFYERLADSEIFLMLTEEAKDENLSPEVFELEDAAFVLAFDLEERLSAFAGRAVPYAALPGRVVAQMLAGQGVGLALNIEVAPSSILIPPEAMAWLTQALSEGPAEGEARPETIAAPRDLPETLVTSLDAKLARMAGLARKAYLAEVTYAGGARGHLLGVTGAVAEAEPALARAIQEALVFSGLEAGALDVVFLADSDPVTAQLARHALRFDLPEAPTPEPVTRAAPGADPDKPPILR